MVKRLHFTKYKSGILELVFTFENKECYDYNLIIKNELCYYDHLGKSQIFKFPESIYQDHDLRNYMKYENTNKDQFVLIFIPQEMFIGKKDPSEVVEFEMEYSPI